MPAPQEIDHNDLVERSGLGRVAGHHLFVNPPDTAYEILFDRAAQEAVADESAAALRARGRPEEYGKSSTRTRTSSSSATPCTSAAAGAVHPLRGCRTPGTTAEGIDEMRLVTTGDFAWLIAEGEVVDPYVLAAYGFATAKGLLKP